MKELPMTRHQSRGNAQMSNDLMSLLVIGTRELVITNGGKL